MAESHPKDIAERVKRFTQKLDDNHHEIELSFNKELKRSLSKSELKEQSAEECDELIKTLTEALELVEGKASHTLAAVKDNLKQAKIDALERKLEYCTCLTVTLRRERSAKEKDALHESGISCSSSTDSRVLSSPGNMLVGQPSDAKNDDSIKEGNKSGEKKA